MSGMPVVGPRDAEVALPDGVGPAATFSGSLEERGGQATRRYGARVRPFSVVRGSKRILLYYEALTRLAVRCGEQDAMVYLPFALAKCRRGAKEPRLLMRRDGRGELESAVLLDEYVLLGIPTGIYVPIGLAGQQTMLVQDGLRSRLAEEVAVFLMRGCGLVVQLSVRDGEFAYLEGRGLGRFRWTTDARTVIQTLPLADTVDGTLALLGARTRRNLRHFRRLAEAELRATFETKVELSESEFLELNRHTLYPVPLKAARCRYGWAWKTPQNFLVGLRGGDGSWLSLLGGRRQGGCTVVDWQMNINTLPAYSLGTVMRAFLLEHEIAQGTRRMTFDGGTPHSMHRAFELEAVTDLLLTRWFMPLGLLRRLIPPRLPEGHVLRKMLLSSTVAWRS